MGETRKSWTIVVIKHHDPDFEPIVWTDQGDSPMDVFEWSLPKHYGWDDGGLPGVDTGLPHDLMLTELYGEYMIAAAFEGALTPVPTDEEEQPEEYSEHDECERMAKELVGLGLNAENVSTGGGCWAVHIKLTDKDALYVTAWPDWAWSLEREGEQLLAGHWGTSDIKRAAKGAKRLIKGLGEIVA
ncbi:hypothetical protein [Streptomyces sp. CB03238]|uniref:hypothetical protein n=1 Tax=Streptomyces sp. CB03238 TaxID=1907777 RepID=UPI000A102131|nr:hypothetical protein [Streptomyces sp. CB03238]ORT58119.1 hypothetical protein BKD26_19600 [Streptomyces sp. CB03238]